MSTKSAKQQAIMDIKNDLMQQSKSFLMFRRELNPVMEKLVHQQIHDQLNLAPRTKKKAQLIAHCLFCEATGTVTLNNYSKYYGKQ